MIKPEITIKQFAIYEGMTVADIGAGSGVYSFLFSNIVGNTGRVYVIDLNKDLLLKIKNEALAKNLDNLEIIQADAEKENGTKLADGVVDFVLVSNLFFQIEDKVGFIKEIKRILKNDGRVGIIDWVPGQGIGPAPKDVVSKEDTKKIFEENNFDFIKEINAGEFHYGIIMRKQ